MRANANNINQMMLRRTLAPSILAPLLVDDGAGGLQEFLVDDGASGTESFDVLAQENELTEI